MFLQLLEHESEIKHEYPGCDNPWISNPVQILNTDLKAAELMYYPYFDSEKAQYLINNLDKAECIAYNPDDIPCIPTDKNCNSLKNELSSRINTIS